jgi:hypothetical protein
MELDFNGLFVTDPLGQVAINPANRYPFLQFGSISDSNVIILFTASANQAGYGGGQVGPYHCDDHVTLKDSNGTLPASLGTGFDTNGSYPSSECHFKYD